MKSDKHPDSSKIQCVYCNNYHYSVSREKVVSVEARKKVLGESRVVSTVCERVTMQETVPTRKHAVIVKASTISQYVHKMRRLMTRSQLKGRNRKSRPRNLQRQQPESARELFYFKLQEQMQPMEQDQLLCVYCLIQEASVRTSRMRLNRN